MEATVVFPSKRGPSPLCEDELPKCKMSKTEDDSRESSTRDVESPSDLIPEGSPDCSPSLPEDKPHSPVNLVAIDFDSAMGDHDNDSGEETSPAHLDTTIRLSETEEEMSSESSEEVQVIKEKQKPVAKKKSRRKTANQRRNIKDVIGQEHLDERTLAAQKEEWARRERIAAKQKSLGMASLPLSMEQIMERFSATSSVSVTPVGAADSEKAFPCTKLSEQEILTISSDDEECIPCYESKAVSQSHGEPPPLTPLSRFYDTFDSDSRSSRSQYSGGTMMVNDRGRTDLTFGESLETLRDKVEEVEDDDDDCVVLSPPPPDAPEEEKDEDAFNVPDAFGRVLVNVGHPPEEPDIFLAPQIARAVKPHQIGGIRFMYDNVVESLERFNNSPGFGCILAHSMGLGKTIQAAAFCDIFLNHTSANTILVIVPINTIQNWQNEFNHWLPAEAKQSPSSRVPSPVPSLAGKKRGRKSKVDAEQPSFVGYNETPSSLSPENSHSSVEEGEEDVKPKIEPVHPRTFGVFLLNETVKNLAARGKIISDWNEKRGVLLIGYEMYRMLALRRLRKPNKKKSFVDIQKDKNEEDATLDKIYSCLVDPGPDLVICDEGHKIKNSGASISQALKAIKTRRRIVLTGYPLQNNLMEYHCMCDFIRPNYLGTKAEFSNMFERPIINGQCLDSTIADKRLMQFRSHVLHSLLEGFVQRRSHLVLQRALPRKEEWVFLVKMTPIQTLLYQEFINYIRMLAEMGNSPPNPIKAFAICCKIWNHPDVLYHAVAKKDKVNEQAVLEDLEDLAEEVESLKRKRGTKKGEGKTRNGPVNEFLAPEEEDSFPGFGKLGESGSSSNQSLWGSSNGTSGRKDNDASFNLDWSQNAFKRYVPSILENGTKFELLFIVIQETVKLGDKLLVFSQSLLTLNLMETFIAMKLQWIKGKEYFRLDGSTTGLERERLIKEFNSNPDIHVFLVSTRAGSLGINLIGANRVVVFDASWNPCHDCQAVCRIYRYGQKKRCQIYRFVADCTLEKKIYDRQITKRGMANRVVDEMNPDAHFSTKDLSGSILLDLDDLIRLQSVTVEHNPDRFDDVVVQQLLIQGGDKISKAPFEHESLLIDRKEKKLSKAERRLALRNYEMEKKSIINQGFTPNGRNPAYNCYSASGGGRSDYSHPVPIAPAPPGWHSLNDGKNFSSRSHYRNSSSNNYFYEKGIPSGANPYTNYHPSDFIGRSNDLPISLDHLRRKGISVQGIVLKKDSFLADPDGGPNIFLRMGSKVYLFRTNRGAYLKLDNGRFIAVRNRLRGKAQQILDTVLPTQNLTKEQVFIIINSILQPSISSLLAGQSSHSSFSASPYFPPNRSSSDYRSTMSVPMSPSYSDYQNQRNLQITNHRSSTGGDVTIWRKDAGSSTQTSGSMADAFGSREEVVPDIEVIKIHPDGEKERIEPAKMGSEIQGHRSHEDESPFNNPFSTYIDRALNSPVRGSSKYPPQVSPSVNSIAEALLGRGHEMNAKYKDPYYESRGQFHTQQQFRNTQSPLDQLRNTVSQLPNYKLPEDMVMDYVGSSSNSRTSNPGSNAIPDSLYAKLLKSQQPQQLMSSPPYSFPHRIIPESNFLGAGEPYSDSNSLYNSTYNKQSNGGGSQSSAFPYYGGGVTANNGKPPMKSIFTPVEQEILDRHGKELF